MGRQDSKSNCYLNLPYLLTGQRHYGRDGNITATAIAKACDDASGTRSGAHAEHHVEALAAANFVFGPIGTGLAHGYAAGKSATHASKVEGAALVPDPSLRIPLPLLSGDGQFRLDDTGGQYTLLGYLLAAIINHVLTDDKRAASQLAAQMVGLTTGGTLKSQAIDVATMLAHGAPFYYNRATLAQTYNHDKLGTLLRAGFCARGYDHGSCLAALAYLERRSGGMGLPLDSAATGGALYDDFLRCLGAPPISRRPGDGRALRVHARLRAHA